MHVSQIAPLAQQFAEIKYEQLDQNLQNQINQIEKYIEDEIRARDEIGDLSLSTIEEEASILHEKLNSLINVTHKDFRKVNNLREGLSTDKRHLEETRRKIPSIQSGSIASGVLPKYFKDLLYEYRKRMERYKKQLDDLERHIHTSSGDREFSPQTLVEIMKNQHDLFTNLSSRVATIHEKTVKFQKQYMELRKRKYGDHSNPFEAIRRRHKGEYSQRNPTNAPNNGQVPGTPAGHGLVNPSTPNTAIGTPTNSGAFTPKAGGFGSILQNRWI
eukprot:TRINITY_DN742_c0_g1_i1.p1 TRINITY_DN742_c0_g1~~TRINITY_DN742_c0_g1_i1.p1  ORF type:complete len:273 (+),score=69.92 TRINITY_DN742_c0_g1_i1:116-934(+)